VVRQGRGLPSAAEFELSDIFSMVDEGVNCGKDAAGSVVGEMPKHQATALDSQREHWEHPFASRPSMFGHPRQADSLTCCAPKGSNIWTLRDGENPSKMSLSMGMSKPKAIC